MPQMTNSIKLQAMGAIMALGGVLYSATAKADPVVDEVDTALIVSVDVSSSVDDHRYQLQMQGIAAALEDQNVMNTVLGGPHGAILFSMVTWADRQHLSVPWTVISNAEQAKEIAKKIRTLPQQGGEFTCMARMSRYILDKVIARMPTRASKIVMDVSGDGPDNCNSGDLLANERKNFADSGITVNGLPILDGQDAEIIEAWYKDNVIAGPGAFLVPAKGYDDFARAFRQKFVVEVSQTFPARSHVNSKLAAEKALHIR
jgi:hypothetical protein